MISIAENSRTLFAMENSVVVLGPVESILPMLRRRIIIAGVRSMGMIRVGEKDILRCNEGGAIFWGVSFGFWVEDWWGDMCVGEC